MSKRSIIYEIKTFKRELHKEFPISKMILFGSRAKDTYRKNSDVDILVVSDKFKRLDQLKRSSKMYKYWSAPYPADFLCYTKKEFEERKHMINIVNDAIRTGISI